MKYPKVRTRKMINEVVGEVPAIILVNEWSVNIPYISVYI